MHYLITGGTGFIGRALCATLLARGHRITVLTRSRTRAQTLLPRDVHPIEDLADLRRGNPPDAAVNLAGENLAAGRWSDARKRLFVDSRVGVTRRLVDCIRDLDRKPRVLISGSAIGYYGARGDEALTEESAPTREFQSELCQAWEAEAVKAELLGMRVCRLRTGIVLGPGGGPLAKMLPPFRLGLGGPLGSGTQWMSWIHRTDLLALIQWLAEGGTFSGAVNATAPAPVTNREFAAALGRALHRPAFMPMPGFALKLLLGGMADILLTGQKVLPARAQAAGFSFRFKTLDAALADILAD